MGLLLPSLPATQSKFKIDFIFLCTLDPDNPNHDLIEHTNDEDALAFVEPNPS